MPFVENEAAAIVEAAALRKYFTFIALCVTQAIQSATSH